MPSPTDRCVGVGEIMFLGFLSVSACVCLCIQSCVLLARYLTNQWTEFHQMLVETTDELIGF